MASGIRYPHTLQGSSSSMPLAVHDYIEASTPNNLRRSAQATQLPPTKHGTWKITPLKRRIIFQIIKCLGSMLNVQGCNPLVDGTNLAAGGFWYVPPAIRNWVFQSHLTFPPSGNPCCQSRYSLHGTVVRPDKRGGNSSKTPEGSLDAEEGYTENQLICRNHRFLLRVYISQSGHVGIHNISPCIIMGYWWRENNLVPHIRRGGCSSTQLYRWLASVQQILEG